MSYNIHGNFLSQNTGKVFQFNITGITILSNVVQSIDPSSRVQISTDGQFALTLLQPDQYFSNNNFFNPSDPPNNNFSSSGLAFEDTNGNLYNMHSNGSTNEIFNNIGGGINNATLNLSVACYLENCKILLDDGMTYKKIIELDINDRIASFGYIENNEKLIFYSEDKNKYESSEIIFLGKFNAGTTPYTKIPRDFFGVDLPLEETSFSNGHRIIINDIMMLCRDYHENKEVPEKENYMYHFECEKHFIVKVNGIFTESMLDCDGSYRNNFQCIFKK
jgi:hypothetical protein